MLFCGIDLHSNNSFIVIIDEEDRVVYSRRHTNRLSEILEAIAPFGDELSCVWRIQNSNVFSPTIAVLRDATKTA